MQVNADGCGIYARGKPTVTHEVGFDIFIPPWLAKHNKLIFTTIFLVGVGITVMRMMGH